MIKIGEYEITKFYLGNEEIPKVSLGDVIIADEDGGGQPILQDMWCGFIDYQMMAQLDYFFDKEITENDVQEILTNTTFDYQTELCYSYEFDGSHFIAYFAVDGLPYETDIIVSYGGIERILWFANPEPPYEEPPYEEPQPPMDDDMPFDCGLSMVSLKDENHLYFEFWTTRMADSYQAMDYCQNVSIKSVGGGMVVTSTLYNWLNMEYDGINFDLIGEASFAIVMEINPSDEYIISNGGEMTWTYKNGVVS